MLQLFTLSIGLKIGNFNYELLGLIWSFKVFLGHNTNFHPHHTIQQRNQHHQTFFNNPNYRNILNNLTNMKTTIPYNHNYKIIKKLLKKIKK